jgi:hypothetical protein
MNELLTTAYFIRGEISCSEGGNYTNSKLEGNLVDFGWSTNKRFKYGIY